MQLKDCVKRPTNLRALVEIFACIDELGCIEIAKSIDRDYILQFFAKPIQLYQFICMYPVLSIYLKLEQYLISMYTALEDVKTVITNYPSFAAKLFLNNNIINLLRCGSDIYDVISLCPDRGDILMSNSDCIKKCNASDFIEIIILNPRVILALLASNCVNHVMLSHNQIYQIMVNYPECAEQINLKIKKREEVSCNGRDNIISKYYDMFGRVISEINQNGQIYYTYNSDNQLKYISTSSHEEHYEYDAAGNLIRKTTYEFQRGSYNQSDASQNYEQCSALGANGVNVYAQTLSIETDYDQHSLQQVPQSANLNSSRENIEYYYANLIDILLVLSANLDKLSKTQIRRRHNVIYYYDARHNIINLTDENKNLDQLLKYCQEMIKDGSLFIDRLEKNQLILIPEFFSSAHYFKLLMESNNQQLLIRLISWFHLITDPRQIAEIAFSLCSYTVNNKLFSFQQTLLGYLNKLFGTYLMPFQSLSIENVKGVISGLENKKHSCAYLLIGYLLNQAIEQQLDIDNKTLEIMLMDALRLYQQAAAELIWHINCNYQDQFHSIKNYIIHIQRESGIQISPSQFCSSDGFVSGKFNKFKMDESKYRVPVNLLAEHTLFASSYREMPKLNKSMEQKAEMNENIAHPLLLTYVG